MIGKTLREMIVGRVSGVMNTSAPGAVQQNLSDPNAPGTRILYTRRSETRDNYLGGGSGPSETTFDVEVISQDLEQVYIIADRLKTLHGEDYDSTTHGCEVLLTLVEDQSDDYFYRGIGEDEATHATALDVSVIWRAKDQPPGAPPPPILPG